MHVRSVCLAAALLSAFVSLPASAQRRRPTRTQTRRPPPPPPPPPPPEPEPEPAPPPRADDPFLAQPREPEAVPPPRAEPARHPRVDIEAQYRLYTHSLTWEGDAEQRAFRDYTLDAASAFRVAAEVYPIAFVSDGVMSNLAVTAAFGMSLALDSQDSMGRHFDTTAYELAAGLRFRLPLAATLPDIGLNVGWSRQVFYVRASETQALGGVPDLVYDGVRFGASARFPIVWRLSLRVDLGGTLVVSSGELRDVFLTRASSFGLDGGLAAAVRIVSGLEARVGFDVRAYLHNANREAGDRYEATGASDTYVTGTFGLAWRQ